MKRFILIGMIICILIAGGYVLSAKDYKVAILQLASSDTYNSLAKAIADETKNNFIIEIVPRSRALYLIENKQTDIVIPYTNIQSAKKQNAIQFDMSNILFKVVYVLYTNKSKNITADELKNGNPKNYKIEVDSVLSNSYEFNAMSSTNLEGSLAKIDNGTIDGYITAQFTGDTSLKKLGLKNIARQQYSPYDSAIIIQKGTKDSEIDKMINDGVAKLKANGKFDKIMGALIKSTGTYDNWQP
jgi:polar amino acid transport system substrate-binding protein